ncbi:enhancer of split m5 protein-like [Stomoxys calcitrans]|uniref:enhancer of split m5 protein-like n=1 Tax=Stomoxys calcitrans TaxID=35570 RepID=UPI0027E303ED|nr:enhancer of split m5 protein-like [Stomoxys calcitrans]
MAPQMEYVSKTQHYLKVKKPLLERQRRARINKCLDTLKELVAEFQGNDDILRLDKAEMLEAAVAFMKTEVKKPQINPTTVIPMDSFRHGYMNAVNEVSRVMAATPGMNVHLGKAVMVHLGSEYNRLLQVTTTTPSSYAEADQAAPMSPASSGYHSDEYEESSMASPAKATPMWRPW